MVDIETLLSISGIIGGVASIITVAAALTSWAARLTHRVESLVRQLDEMQPQIRHLMDTTVALRDEVFRSLHDPGGRRR